MFSYQSVNGANIVCPEDSEKNGNFWKMTFYPKMMLLFFSEYLKFSIFSKNQRFTPNTISTFLGVKETQIWPEKEFNPLRG